MNGVESKPPRSDAVSDHPLYKLGYSRGRKRTEEETAELLRVKTDNERWNHVFLLLLPMAMQVSNWVLGEKTIQTVDQRIELAKALADSAVKEMKRP